MYGSRFIVSILFFLYAMTTPAHAENRADVLKELRSVQETYKLNMDNLNKTIQQQLISTRTIKINQGNERIGKQNLLFIYTQLDDLRKSLNEYKQRQYVIDRIIFQIDTKFTNGSNLKIFLEQQLLDMSYTELFNNSNNEDNHVWQFMIDLSIAIREIHNPHENVIDFVKDFLSYSTVSNPKSPFNFLHEGNYANGGEVTTGNPIPADQVGEAWEDQVKKIINRSENRSENFINEEHTRLRDIRTPDELPKSTIFEGKEYPKTFSDPEAEKRSKFNLEIDGYSNF